MTIGLYIHIPFCKQKCFYCDFPSYTGLDHLYKEYTAALCREIARESSSLSGKLVDTIFIGGGTPTLLPAELLAQILRTVNDSFSITGDAEISMEANPGTVDIHKLKMLRQHGINRLSFGVQSFNDALLKSIGRIHSAAEAVEAVKLAQVAGFKNINVDLIYGLPKQTLRDVKESLIEAVLLNIQHISVYGLKVEDGTAFAAQEALGKLALPEEITEETMYEEINSFLPQQGFGRYEISNFAKANFSCRHNIKYWRYQPYIGLGAAAYSFGNGKRYGNTADIQTYISALNKGQSANSFSEELADNVAMAEFVFLALRMTSGLNVHNFNAYFKKDFFSHYGGIITQLANEKLLTVNRENIALTPLGMKFGNIVFRAFLPD